MPKYVSIFALVTGIILVAAFGLVTFAALSDAQVRCPGIQCSDARASAAIGSFLVALGLVLGAIGFLSLRR